MKNILILLFPVLYANGLFAQNQNISNWAFFDAEPYIAVNPTNPNNVIAAWIKVTTFTSAQIAVSYSNDAGVTWSAPQHMPHFSSTFTSADPSIDFNSTGKAFLTYVDYKLSLDSGKVVIVSSVNGGQNWSALQVVTDGLETPDLPVDRPWIGIDRSGGAYDGRIYVVSINVETGSTTNHVYLKYSSDDGATWSPLDIIDDSIPADLTRTMGALAIASDGSVNIAYISWHLPLSFAARLIMVKSVDGGQTFTPYIMGIPPANTAINDTLQGSTTLSANPVNAQNLIFTYTSASNGDADILSINSVNGGLTWSASTPVRVNDDPVANGNHQDMSWAGFSPNGAYFVAWRDRRNSGTSVVSPFEIWTAGSFNGGLTFGPNSLISSVLSPDIPVPKGNDFIGIAVSANLVHFDWCDNRTGNYEIFYHRDSVNTLLSVPEKPDISPAVKTYPNPATDRISFSFNLNTDQAASVIEITDVTGKTVRVLYAGTMSRGPHEVIVDVSSLPDGLYFFRVRGDSWESAAPFIVE